MKKKYYETKKEVLDKRKIGESIYYVAGKGYYLVKIKRRSFFK